MAIGVILLKNGKKVREIGRRLNVGTNNIAEWRALIEGLKVAKDMGCRELVVKGDSTLIIKQITGSYQVKSKHLIPLFDEARKLSRHFEKITFRWITREQNALSDALSNRAFER